MATAQTKNPKLEEYKAKCQPLVEYFDRFLKGKNITAQNVTIEVCQPEETFVCAELDTLEVFNKALKECAASGFIIGRTHDLVIDGHTTYEVCVDIDSLPFLDCHLSRQWACTFQARRFLTSKVNLDSHADVFPSTDNSSSKDEIVVVHSSYGDEDDVNKIVCALCDNGYTICRVTTGCHYEREGYNGFIIEIRCDSPAFLDSVYEKDGKWEIRSQEELK